MCHDTSLTTETNWEHPCPNSVNLLSTMHDLLHERRLDCNDDYRYWTFEISSVFSSVYTSKLYGRSWYNSMTSRFSWYFEDTAWRPTPFSLAFNTSKIMETEFGLKIQGENEHVKLSKNEAIHESGQIAVAV